MKKISKIAISMVLCVAMVSTTGCSLSDKVSTLVNKTKSNADYVTLGDYKSVNLKTADIDAKVQSSIDDDLGEHADYKHITKGKVKDKDTVNIYYVGKVDGKKFDGGSCTKENYPTGYDLTIGSGSFIDGFEDGLIGAKVGSKLKVKVTFPDPYTNNPDLAGKPAVFDVTVNYIRGAQITPELDEDYVKENLSDYKSVDDYKTSLRSDTIEAMAWDAVFNAAKVNDYPQDKVDAMYKQLNTSITYYLEQNSYALSDYLSAQNTTSADFKKQLTDTAKQDVGKQLVYGAIADEQKITVSDEDYQKELKDYLTNYNCDDEDALNKIFNSYYGTDAKEIIEDDLLFKAVKAYLVKNVKES